MASTALQLTVTWEEDGTDREAVIVTRPGDMAWYERQQRRDDSLPPLASESVTPMVYMSWRILRRGGQTGIEDVTRFVDAVVDIAAATTATADPTQPAPTPVES